MKKYHKIENLNFDNDNLNIIIDGKDYSFSIDKFSKAIFNASNTERNTFEISPSGYGIHWPLIDEDISIDGLLGIVHSPERQVLNTG